MTDKPKPRGNTHGKNFKGTKLNELSPEKARKVQAKGGRTKTAKTKLAKWKNAMKGFSSPNNPAKLREETKRLIEMASKPGAYSIEILREIERIRKENPDLDIKDHLALVTVMNNTHKTIHGEKKNLEVSGHTTQDIRVAEIAKVVLATEKKKKENEEEVKE